MSLGRTPRCADRVASWPAPPHPPTGCSDPRSVRALAARLDLRPTKQRGQNFVIDANTIRRIVAPARLRPDDVVLEVGPGARFAHAGTAAGRRPRDRGRDRAVAGAGARRRPSPRGHRRAVERLTVLQADALSLPRGSGPSTHGPGGEPALQHRRAGAAHAAREPAVDHHRRSCSSSWRWPTGWPPGPGSKTYGVPSVKAAWYGDVDDGGPGQSLRLLAGAQRGLRPGAADPARTAWRRSPAASHVRRRRCRLRHAPQDAPGLARRPGRRHRTERGGAAGRRSRPRAPRVRRSTWTRSSGSAGRSATYRRRTTWRPVRDRRARGPAAACASRPRPS